MTTKQRKRIVDSLKEYSHLVYGKLKENFMISDNRIESPKPAQNNNMLAVTINNY